MSIQIHSFLGETEGEKKTFFGECKEGVRCSLRLLQEQLVIVKFGILPPLLCYLLDSLTNKYSKTWSSLINIVDGFRDLSP